MWREWWREDTQQRESGVARRRAGEVEWRTCLQWTQAAIGDIGHRRDAARYKLGLAGFDSRVVMLHGDAKCADLGLSTEQWDTLARSVGNVFHLAANSSFIATYEVLRGEWIPSFTRLLEFCTTNAEQDLEMLKV